MNHKDQIVLSPDARRGMAEVKMAMVRAASVEIKNIFPALGMKMPKAHQTKSLSHTRKGSGRKHKQSK